MNLREMAEEFDPETRYRSEQICFLAGARAALEAAKGKAYEEDMPGQRIIQESDIDALIQELEG